MNQSQEDAYRFMLGRHLELMAEGETNCPEPLPEDFDLTPERAAEIKAEMTEE